MKLEKAYSIIKEEWHKIEDYENIAEKIEDATEKLRNDIVKIKEIIDSNQKSDIKWKDMSYVGYRNLFTKCYSLKENALEFLRLRKEYELNPNSPRAKILASKFGVANNGLVKSSNKIVRLYAEAYVNAKELTRLIRLGRSLSLLNINIPSAEFRQPIREETL